ncbi:bacterio-opsin activator domain-containing protein [Halobaculum limi]|uniref:bacterio-opsin activator domain-containing protein n=1 Tax=Halobaculum limi TaxID=3031916 RepID=UPI002404BEE6|nr:bacterio-opsin activator domain-containing protein [Halobaculum sp. YSMS11]
MSSEVLSAALHETLEAFPRRGQPLTTTEIAANLGVGRRGTYDRLRRLEAVGRIESKKVGSGGRVWWRPVADEDDERPDTDENGEARHRYRTLVEQFPNGALALVDERMRYTTFGGSPEGTTALTSDDLEGERLATALPPSIADVVIPGYERALDGDVSTFEATVDDQAYRFHFYPVRDDDGRVFEALGMSQEVTARRAYQQKLEARIRQQEAVAALGQRALEVADVDDLFAEATRVVAETLGHTYCKVLDLNADTDELLLRQGVGWDDGIVGSATVSAVEDDSQAAYTLRTAEPVVVEDLDEERRFSGPDLLTSHGVRSGISTIIGSPESPWGILGTHDTAPAALTDHDAAFVQSVANVLASSIERARHEREVEHQRTQLAALNSVNRVVRKVSRAIVERSTREEIERVTCERLATADSYQFAWIGDVGAASREIRVRAEAGVEGYLDGTRISVDPDDDHAWGPTGRAYQTGTVQTTQHAAADPRQDPWDEQVATYGYRSSAAIPIVHDGTVYGVLNVYSERERAFVGREREVIAQLGEVVGHAIAAADRKQALLGDQVVELEFLITDVFDPAAVGPSTDPIYLDHAAPRNDGEFVLFGRTTTAGMATLEEAVETHPLYEEVVVRSDGDPQRFELTVTDLPVLSAVAAQGGELKQVVIEDGDSQVTVCLSPNADARRVIDVMRETYPDASLLRREQVDRTEVSIESSIDALTDRQRTALATAFHAGYFSWPRDATAEEVADSLGIAASTLHQHLRTGQAKVFDAVFCEE